MIQSFAHKYRKPVAYFLFTLFYVQSVIFPLQAALNITGEKYVNKRNFRSGKVIKQGNGFSLNKHQKNTGVYHTRKDISKTSSGSFGLQKADIGGPSSPEAASFKAVGSDNLVNIFTGDFSYGISLLDVGGYPVNLSYSGGIGMEDEASWVGLGWNINPGTVNRNMRGVPDDFNGDDKLIQTQNVKPNRTWGGEVGIDGELLGIKFPRVNMSLGFSYNNYLGPAMDIGAGISVSLPLTESIKHEKQAPPKDTIQGLFAGIGLNAKLSSRSGLTFSPSLNANLHLINKHSDYGIGLSTSYNSRTGLKELKISSQMSTYRNSGKQKGTFSKNLADASISFARPTYIPTLRMPMEYANYSGQLEIGFGKSGARGAAQANGYYSESKVPIESMTMLKPLIGFIYSEKANGNKDAVMDFNRLNDAEVTPNTPIISAPQYAYDIFSIQGEGTGGTIRAYRGDLGFMRDNETRSKDKDFSIGFDIAPPDHFGFNWNITKTPTRVGGWDDANNTLNQTFLFKDKVSGSSFENVYFRNPGEATVTNPQLLSRIGGDNLVRFKLSGSNVNPRLESTLEQFSKKTNDFKGDLPLTGTLLQNRDKRTQVITMLTAADAAVIGLEKEIRNYSGGFDAENYILYNSISRVGDFRKTHHISEIDVLESSGSRYVYGIPVYNLKQKDFTFSVGKTEDPVTGIVNFDSDEPTLVSRHMNNNSKIDGYMMSQETPAYAASFLLTGLLSSDYVDRTGNGITEDDLGGAVKFNYNRSTDVHKWRTPRQNSVAATAHFNEGLKSEKKDNKANITYGEREVWYLNTIESKSMIAIFTTESRDDAKGVIGELDGRVNTSENANKRLKKIDLYTKAEIKSKGIASARPIKTVHFMYDYSLCKGTPDNKNGNGKLTLTGIYFTFNGQPRTIKDKYVFNYGNNNSEKDNPAYANKASDKWGTYKSADTNPVTNAAANPAGLTNSDYPYTSTNKSKNDEFAAAWNLKKILLPSGGQMEITYESDDYGYVQNRRACNMFNIYGMGSTTNATQDHGLYNSGHPAYDNYYAYIKLPQPLESITAAKQRQEIFDKYLEGNKQLAFKLLINMPKGPEALTVYAKYDDYGLCANSTNKDIIYVKLQPVDGKSPLSNSAIGFIAENLTPQAFEGYEIESGGVEAFTEMIVSMLGSIRYAFKNVDDQMRSLGKARTLVLDKSFVRLNNPDKIKYGGGHRVKRVIVKDNWSKMTNQFTSTYGQDYDYTTTERINGKETIISSGVASYEPGLGSEENPFREIVAFSNSMPHASAQYGAIEMPMLEGLYPSPVVGYSKITVRSIHRKGTHGDSSLRSAIGKQVTEFYTAKDYPTYSAYTPMANMDYHRNSFFNLLYKDITDRRVTSQGFLVETNDMHGKMKSQSAYSESDEKTPLSYSHFSYKNTGKNGLNDKIDFISNEQQGAVTPGNMGIDMELMTDVREFRTQTHNFNGQIQVDFFTWVPFPVFVIPMIPIKTYTENKYRAVTCTKLINYHAVEDSVIVMDKGSVVSTKAIAYDAETGGALVTKTANEFNDPVYNVNFPAYWAYSSMAPAYRNTDRQFTNINFNDGKITNLPDMNTIFESGDELYITKPGSGSSGCIPASPNVIKLWAFDKNKNTTALTVPNKDLIFLDSAGNLFTQSNVSFRIIRSGKRNYLGNSVASATTMVNPIAGGTLAVNNNSKVIGASAMEYKEKWQNDNSVFKKYKFVYDLVTCTNVPVEDCEGVLSNKMNPYLNGLIGNCRGYQEKVFYGSRAGVSTLPNSTNIRKDGYLADFSNYWNFNTASNLVPDNANLKWVWNTRGLKYNVKGQGLEAKDAMNIYTSALYGFDETVTLAAASNSRYNEMFGEGFEDYGFAQAINKNTYVNNCAKKHIDFTNSINAKVANTDTLNLKAHSGRRVLQIAANAASVKKIPVITTVMDDYNFSFPSETTRTLTDVGGNVESVVTYPATMWQPGYAESNTIFTSGVSCTFNPVPNDTLLYINGEYSRVHNFTEITSQYINITTANNYTLGLQACTNTQNANMVVNVFDLNGNYIGGASANVTDANGNTCQTAEAEVRLCPGIYKIHGVYSGSYQKADNGAMPLHEYGYTYSLGCGSETYRTTTIQNGCTIAKPIPVNDSMINPTFALYAGKKMLFSGWVRENCATPCRQLSYANSTIELNFGGAGQTVTLRPSGTIIEGWQKVEGEFTVPSNATIVSLRFVNNGADPVYWDDIRMHPFNANMKTFTYDQKDMRMVAELNEDNYASFYEYDEEGQLIRVKQETIQGIKTISESRASKQKAITDLQ